ncbi:hypothetical protein SAMN04487897_1352 [Paenibacillus sp. yr247]|uniref:hypothetical protein n=1 Tax=Paenibacillus sp. yr247 TaxID=1761880 RepID=UPI00087F9AA2|nr:hypothetical protein [Paenibacillus sp. yr247]SDP07848.1 hypothetical protein SAMN04487897_1352 [Paenibacillus sp. yr247]
MIIERNSGIKYVDQTIVYITHFVSWVVVVGISYIFITTEGEINNDLVVYMGFPIGEFHKVMMRAIRYMQDNYRKDLKIIKDTD